MEVQDTGLIDAKLITPLVFEDDRGYFKETYQIKRYVDCSLWKHWAQDGVSYSKTKYTLRGLHYQPYMAKLVQVLQGAVYDVIVDIRPGSKTYKQWQGFELSDSNHRQLFVPVGFLHGFLTLTDNVVFTYKMTELYDASTEKAVHWLTPELNINWPIPRFTDFIISEKDQNASHKLPESFP